MLWPVLSAILAAVYSWRIIFRFGDHFIDHVFGAFIFLCFMSLAFIVGGFLSLMIGVCIPTQWKEIKRIPLVSLRSGNATTGLFFVGLGSLGEDLCYFYYEKVGEGYKPGKIKVDDNVTVFEQPREDAERVMYSLEFKNSVLDAFAISPGIKKYEFYIPNGSLRKEFVL